MRKIHSYDRYLIEDTRQQKGKHEVKHACFDEMSVSLIRCKLPFGDYAKPPKVSVDTKMDMSEIAMDIDGEHKRFKAECVAARDAGCHLIILVENTYGIKSVDDVHTWINPRLVYSPKAITGERMEKAMKTMHERYGVSFEFCRPEEAAQRVMELLEAEDG